MHVILKSHELAKSSCSETSVTHSLCGGHCKTAHLHLGC